MELTTGNQGSNFTGLMIEILEEEGISYQLFSGGWVFRIQRGEENPQYIYGYQFGLNSDASQLLCDDKAAASELLSFYGIPNVAHHYFMNPDKLKFASPAGNWRLMMDLLSRYKKVVCKENKGTGGNAVYIAQNQLELEQVAHKIMEKSDAMAVCPYIVIEGEYRIIVLNGKVRLAYEKIRPSLTGDGKAAVRELYAAYLLQEDSPFQAILPLADKNRVPAAKEEYPLHWKHNLGQGANAFLLEDQEEIAILSDLALQAVKALGVVFASVDIIKCREGYKVMEMNSGVMMEYFAGENEEYRTLAKEIYRDAVKTVLCSNETWESE